jgi:hypothetical protein
MGTFFPLGEVATSGWGGGGYIPPNSQKFRLRRAKIKKGRRFLRKVFYYMEKIAIPPQPVLAGGTEVLGGGGGI